MQYCGLSEADGAAAAAAMDPNSDGNISADEYFVACKAFLTEDDLDSPANTVFGELS